MGHDVAFQTRGRFLVATSRYDAMYLWSLVWLDAPEPEDTVTRGLAETRASGFKAGWQAFDALGASWAASQESILGAVHG